MFSKAVRILAGAGLVLAALGVGLAHADPNPLTVKKAQGYVYVDSLISATSSTDDTLSFGKPTDYVKIQSFTSAVGFSSRIFGMADLIPNCCGSGASNPRAGLATVVSTLITPPTATGSYTSYTYNSGGAPIYFGVRIKGTGTATLLVTWRKGVTK